jgi:hypothetical protein
MLSMYLNEDQSNWDITLPLITFAYNASKSKSTRFSPFELLYGRKPTFPQDINLEALPSVFRDTDHYIEIMAKINVKQAQKKYKQYYDRNRKEYCYKPGQKVAVFVPIRVPVVWPFHSYR